MWCEESHYTSVREHDRFNFWYSRTLPDWGSGVRVVRALMWCKGVIMQASGSVRGSISVGRGRLGASC